MSSTATAAVEPSTSSSSSPSPTPTPIPETEEVEKTATESTSEQPAASPAAVPSSGSWQAIFSPQYNAYYFYNTETKETTWENPIVKSDAPESDVKPAAEDAEEPKEETEAEGLPKAPTAPITTLTALQQAALAQGIDPSLAYLDPTLAGPSSSTGGYGAAAKFNARTGQFTRADARDPSHLSEFERAKRMSEFYFDVNAWEKQKAEEDAAAAEELENGTGKKRKRLTKKDLVRVVHFTSTEYTLRLDIRTDSRNRRSKRRSRRQRG